MKIHVILYLLIALFLFILIHPHLPIQEGMDDCIVNTLADLKNEVSELKKKVDANSNEKSSNYKATPEETEDGVFLKDNINSI